MRRSSILGWPAAPRVGALKSRLAAAGIPMRRVHTVIVTHSHPDHFGAAGWVRHETGADIVTHRRFRLMWDPSEPPDVDVEDVVERCQRRRRRLCRIWELQAELALRSKPRMPWDPAPWGGSGMTIPFRRRSPADAVGRGSRGCSVSRCRPCVSTTPGRSASPAASGWRCTPPVTPRTTCACSTRPTA